MNWTGPNDAPLSTPNGRKSDMQKLIDNLDLDTNKGRELAEILARQSAESERNMFDPYQKAKAELEAIAPRIYSANWLVLDNDRNRWRRRARFAFALGAIGWAALGVVLLLL